MPRIRIDFKPCKSGPRLWFRWTLLPLAVAFLSWGAGIVLIQKLHQDAAASFFLEEPLPELEEPIPEPSYPRLLQNALAQHVPLAKLEIPRLKVSGYVEEGFESQTLRRAIGHAPLSAMPGQRGNIVLAAHRDTFFAGLRDVRNGDIVHLRTRDGKTVLYKVSNVFVVHPVDSWVMQPTPGRDLLTLITCYPFHFIGSAPNRLVVQAKPLVTHTT